MSTKYLKTARSKSNPLQVKRLRYTAGILLELVQNVANETLKDRVKSQFEQILDFLARLDPKTTNALRKYQQQGRDYSFFEAPEI